MYVILEGSVESFRYLGDELCPGGGCELATIAGIKAAQGTFC